MMGAAAACFLDSLWEVEEVEGTGQPRSGIIWRLANDSRFGEIAKALTSMLAIPDMQVNALGWRVWDCEVGGSGTARLNPLDLILNINTL